MNTATASLSIAEKIQAYIQLLKLRLTLTVVFSAVMTYLLASSSVVDWTVLGGLAFGGLMITGSANILNQIYEVEFDRLMKRTENRPLPTGRLSKLEALVFAVVLMLLGFILQFLTINPLCAGISLLSLVLYAFVYTPLKRVGPIAVFVGAFPGAFPPLIGWVAFSNEITIEAMILFGIQFIWQFPHFWAIAWVAYEDYKRAGYRLLPSKGRNLNTAFKIMSYTIYLIPLSLLPHWIGLTGVVSAVVVVFAGIAFLMQTFYLMRKCDQKAAKWLMFGSFIYLPIVQISFVFDRI